MKFRNQAVATEILAVLKRRAMQLAKRATLDNDARITPMLCDDGRHLAMIWQYKYDGSVSSGIESRGRTKREALSRLVRKLESILLTRMRADKKALSRKAWGRL